MPCMVFNWIGPPLAEIQANCQHVNDAHGTCTICFMTKASQFAAAHKQASCDCGFPIIEIDGIWCHDFKNYPTKCFNNRTIK